MDRRAENRAIIRWMLGLGIAAFSISITTSVMVLLFMIGYNQELSSRDQRIAKLEGMVQARLQMESDLRADFQLWQSYCASLEKSMIEFGVKVPKFPGKLKGSTDIISSTIQKGEK